MTDTAVPSQVNPIKQIAEELISQGDPNALASMIVEGKLAGISESEQRELLARAFTHAARIERQAAGTPLILTEPGSGGAGISRQLDAMALDLRYNPGGLSLLEQIYIFYPSLKRTNS